MPNDNDNKLVTLADLAEAYNALYNRDVTTTATQSADGLMSSTDKTKLDGIASGAQVNSITGVKGDAESSFRTGNVNLTAANVGAVPTGLTTIADCDDNTLHGNGNQIHFYKTSDTTLNTPFKQGLTAAALGVLIVLGNTDYTTQIHFQSADTKYYIRSKDGSGSTWNGKAWTINVLKPDMVGEEIPLLSNPLAINNGRIQYTNSYDCELADYKFVDLYFLIQGGYTNAIRLCPEYGENLYKFGFFAWNPSDNVLRKVAVSFGTAGRYFTNCVVCVAYGDNGVLNATDNVLYLYKAIGYKW